MIPFVSAAVALALIGAAAIIAPFTLGGKSQLQGWVVSGLGALALAFAALSHTTALMDLATVAGVVIFGGMAGAGWNPRGRRALLALGAAALIAGMLPRYSGLLDAGVGAAALGGSLTWAVARAAGFAAFLASAGAILLGVRRPARLPVGGLPARVYALHRALGITAILAVAVHIFALQFDSFVRFSWLQLLALPWTSSYRPLAVTLGFLAMVSLLLTASSAALRRRLPGWRTVHLLSYVTFGLSIVHGLLAGSDSGSLTAILIYGSALVAVGLTVLRKLLTRPSPRQPVVTSGEGGPAA